MKALNINHSFNELDCVNCIGEVHTMLWIRCELSRIHLTKISQQTAGNAVKKAADNLVTAAKNAAIFEEQESTVIINQRFVGGIAQELEAQEKILRIEKELAAARNKLSQIRQAKYRAEEED